MKKRNCTAPSLSEIKRNKQSSQVTSSKKILTQQPLNKYDFIQGTTGGLRLTPSVNQTESVTDSDSDTSSQQSESDDIISSFHACKRYKEKIECIPNILEKAINDFSNKIKTNNNNKKTISELMKQCNRCSGIIKENMNKLYYFLEQSLIRLKRDNRVLFQQININHNYNQLLCQYIRELDADNEKFLTYCDDYKNKIKSLQEELNELKDEQEENNEFINILKQIDEKNIDPKTEIDKSNKKTNKSQLPVIQQRVYNSNVVNKNKKIRQFILDGKIKGNNMDFFRRYQEKYDWRDIRNQQIKQKNILPLINK